MGIKRDISLSRKPLAGFFAIGVAWAVFFAQMPVIKAQVGASDGAYGLAMLLSSLGALAAMWLAPAFRAVAGGRAIAFGIVLVGCGMFLGGAAGTLMALTLAMFLSACGSGVVDVLVNARVSEIEEEHDVKLMNLNHALYSFAYAGGALVTSVLRSFDVGTVVTCGALFVVLLLLAVASRDKPPQIEEDTGARDTGPFALLVTLTGLIVMAAFLAEAATEGWSALHLERTLGASVGVGALGPAVLGLMMGIGRLTGHWLTQRFRESLLMLLATLIAAGGIALAGLAPSVGIALAGFAVAGLGVSVVAPIALSSIGRIVPPSQRLAAISRASVIGYGAFFLGPSVMGLVAEGFGLRASFMLIAVVLGLTGLVLIPALVKARPS